MQSDLYNGDGKEIVMPNVLPENSVCINEKYISTIWYLYLQKSIYKTKTQ